MKNIFAAIALATVAMSAHAQPLDRTQEYRMWSAEQEINHLVERMARTTAACGQVHVRVIAPKASEACREAVINAYPVLKIIREVAASGNVVEWANIMDAIHTLDKDIEAPLNILERK